MCGCVFSNCNILSKRNNKNIMMITQIYHRMMKINWMCPKGSPNCQNAPTIATVLSVEGSPRHDPRLTSKSKWVGEPG